MAARSDNASTRMEPIAKAAFVLILAGAGLAAIGLRFGGPAIGGAIAVFGVAATLGGVHSMSTRRHRTGGWDSSLSARDHSGAAAVLYGLAFLIPGVLMILGGGLLALGQGDGIVAWVAARPGPTAMALGGWIVLGGVGNMVSRWTHVGAPTVWWQRVPSQLVGVLVVAIGIGMIAIGWTLAADPEHPREALGRIAEWVAQRIAGGE